MTIQTFTAPILAILLLLSLSGCGFRALEERVDALEAAADYQLEALEELPGVGSHSSPSGTSPAAPAKSPEAATTAASPADAAPPATEEETVLTAADAKAIALEHAGLTEDQVKFLRTEYEVDDRVPQYDVQFREGHWEHEYEIHAHTGQILSYEKDTRSSN